MRWDIFLPFRAKAEQGPLRRGLGLLGPTWQAAPLRRVVQAASLLAFLWLFFYVCWPYTARPARDWNGWIPAEVDAATGKSLVVAEHPPAEPIAAGMVLHVVDRGEGKTDDFGPFRVTGVEEKQLAIEPIGPLRADVLDRLSGSLGPWSLGEASPGSWPSHYADDLRAKEKVPAEIFLALDPLVSLSTALAARTWVWSLGCAGAVLLVCLAIPRGFCGYVCPLGTLIDLSDWALGRRLGWLRVPAAGWWVYLKYYLLAATLLAALLGVLASGFVAAIPVLTRGLAFLLSPLQTAAERGWHQVPPIEAGHIVSIGLFLAVLLLGLLQPRFWCKYVCPSGAVFSTANLLRLNERKVTSSCIGCGKCVEICPFDAIQPDFTTRTGNCTFCQTCGGACPTRAIEFAGRWSRADGAADGRQPGSDVAWGRRRFVSTLAGVAAGGVGFAGVARVFGARLDDADAPRPVRPPGSVPEREFLRLCIRCGECFQACPNGVLQPLGFEQGIEGLWTPQVVADWSGCEPSCANCGQVCPTGAIRPLPLAEKRAAHIGLAVVDQCTCLPYARRAACQLCVDECRTAGYEAIEFIRVGTEMDDQGAPVEDSGFLAPVVRADRCVGCGLCQTRCLAINATQKGLLRETAIRVAAGQRHEDRLTSGSYRELRQRQQIPGHGDGVPSDGGKDGYLPEFLK